MNIFLKNTDIKYISKICIDIYNNYGISYFFTDDNIKEKIIRILIKEGITLKVQDKELLLPYISILLMNLGVIQSLYTNSSYYTLFNNVIVYGFLGFLFSEGINYLI